MASLEIRHLPDDVYLALAFSAAQAHRILAQQTVIDLRLRNDSSSGQRKGAVLQKISAPLSAQVPELAVVLDGIELVDEFVPDHGLPIQARLQY